VSPRPRRSKADTRQRIVQAAVDTLREQGIVGTSARAIAQRGGFNQALIFYHFGSITNLLLEAFRETSETQVAKYRSAAEGVESLRDLVEIARRLHEDDLATGAVTAVTQLMAAASTPEEGRAILERFDAWIRLVEETLDRALPSSLAGVVPRRESAYAIAAMFLGIELMSRLDPELSEAEAVFDMMANMAQVIEAVAPALLPSLLGETS
jgi:AcrR family transcriptional regulator